MPLLILDKTDIMKVGFIKYQLHSARLPADLMETLYYKPDVLSFNYFGYSHQTLASLQTGIAHSRIHAVLYYCN